MVQIIPLPSYRAPCGGLSAVLSFSLPAFLLVLLFAVLESHHLRITLFLHHLNVFNHSESIQTFRSFFFFCFEKAKNCQGFFFVVFNSWHSLNV